MTDDEINELKALLVTEAKTTFVFERLYRADLEAVYAERDAFGITEHEMRVFGLSVEAIPRLAAALMFYEEMSEVTIGQTEGRTYELIQKARRLAPDDEFYGHTTSFEDAPFHINWFMWFAVTFADVTMRDAYAFYRKHEIAGLHLREFADGS